MPEDGQESGVALVDGQSVVDAVAQDTQTVADSVVDRVEVLLREQSESSGSGDGEVVLSAAQWSELSGHMRFTATCGMLGAFASMAVFGALCAQLLVSGWRRG